jgi:hypothetical protein
MIKKLIIIIVAAVGLIAAAIFIYRYQILQYTAETLIRKRLPNYVRINNIRFDFSKGEVVLSGFKILNPPEFSKEYLMEIEKISCRYKMRGKTILDGPEFSGPAMTGAVLDIERLGDGKLNLLEAETMIEGRSPAKAAPGHKEGEESPSKASGNKRLAASVKLPETFMIKNAKVIFTDRLTTAKPSVITFENINAELTLKMDEYHSRVLAVNSAGEGYVNGDSGQVVKWTVALNPTAPRLTMSSRLEVSGVAITPFEPYYDKYSPLVFKAGRFSGLLIFDFDNGVIGSSDELRLSDLKFFVKQGYENATFWETTVPDLVKYFTSPYGEIIFDFKIKGEMADPKFYLGPKSKEAIISMAVDKISAAIQKGTESPGGAPKNDIGKAKQYIDLFKGLIKN